MLEIYKKITVDLSRKSNVRLIFARQNDVGSRNLMITLTDGGSVYVPDKDSSATLNFKRSDDVRGAVAASIMRNGDVLVEVPALALGAVGETVCSVSLFDPQKNKLTSSDFILEVCEEFYSGEALDDEPDYTLLQSVFAEMAEYAGVESERVEAENIRQENEEKRILAENIRDKKLTNNLGFGGSLRLPANGWDSDFCQKVVATFMGADDMIQLFPATRADRAVMTNYRVFVEPEVSGYIIKFVADAKPAADINLKYFVTKGRAV